MLQDLYDSEINFMIKANWDAGFDVALGGGYRGKWDVQSTVRTYQDAVAWLLEQAKKVYPDSAFTANSNADNKDSNNIKIKKTEYLRVSDKRTYTAYKLEQNAEINTPWGLTTAAPDNWVVDVTDNDGNACQIVFTQQDFEQQFTEIDAV